MEKPQKSIAQTKFKKSYTLIKSNTFTGSITDQLVPFSGSGSAGLDLTNNSNSFSGTISNICVSDTAGQCATPTPSPAPQNRFNNIFGNATSSASASTTLSIIDIPNLDLFMGYLTFFSVVVFVVWIFK